MAQPLWGALIRLPLTASPADVLLYDHIVVPVPPRDEPDEQACWEARWNPQRQRDLLDVLGDFALPIERSRELRDEGRNCGHPRRMNVRTMRTRTRATLPAT